MTAEDTRRDEETEEEEEQDEEGEEEEEELPPDLAASTGCSGVGCFSKEERRALTGRAVVVSGLGSAVSSSSRVIAFPTLGGCGLYSGGSAEVPGQVNGGGDWARLKVGTGPGRRGEEEREKDCSSRGVSSLGLQRIEEETAW